MAIGISDWQCWNADIVDISFKNVEWIGLEEKRQKELKNYMLINVDWKMLRLKNPAKIWYL